MRLRALLFAALCWAVPAQAWAAGTAVLMYHKVNPVLPRDPVGNDLTVTPGQFAAQLRALKEAGIAGVAAAAAIAGLRSGARSREVALTFDDGYADNYRYALPLLEHYGMHATFFIISSTVGTPGHLSWREIRALRAAGMEIAAHGAAHVDLRELDYAGQRAQGARCIAALRRYAGVTPRTYAYPGGGYDAITLRVMHDLGFMAAFTTRPGNVASLADRYELPRWRVHRVGSEDLFRHLTRPRRARSARRPAQIEVNASARAAGTRKPEAIALARVLLRTQWPAQVLKVRVDGAGAHAVAGIVISGVRFHRPLDRRAFAAEVTALARAALAAGTVQEVDLWATVPLAAPVGMSVSGDMAAPTAKTVFSFTLERAHTPADLEAAILSGPAAFWDPGWSAGLGR